MKPSFNRYIYIYIYIYAKIKYLFNSIKSVLNRISLLVKSSPNLCHICVFFKHRFGLLFKFKQGFTLPELAIAISVAGIIATAGMMAYKSTNP